MSRVLLRHSFSDTDPFPSSFRFFWLFIHLTVFRSKRHVKITFCESTMTLNFFLGIHEKIDFPPRWFPLLLLEVEFLISLSFLSRLLDFGPNLNCPLISHLTHTHTHTYLAFNGHEHPHCQLCAMPQPFYAMWMTQVIKEHSTCTHMTITPVWGLRRAWNFLYPVSCCAQSSRQTAETSCGSSTKAKDPDQSQVWKMHK